MSPRSAQSNEVRLGRLKSLKARDDAMQAVLAETAAKLPSLAQGSGYTSLLEGLILEGLIAIDEPKVSVKGVAGQGSVAQKACNAAAIKYLRYLYLYIYIYIYIDPLIHSPPRGLYTIFIHSEAFVHE